MDISKININGTLYDIKDLSAIRYIGNDPITSLADDKPITWANTLGAGYWWISKYGVVTD